MRTIGEVIHLFGDGPPAAEESDVVADFCNEHLGDFLAAVTNLDGATTVEEFEDAKAEVVRLVKGWPK